MIKPVSTKWSDNARKLTRPERKQRQNKPRASKERRKVTSKDSHKGTSQTNRSPRSPIDQTRGSANQRPKRPKTQNHSRTNQNHSRTTQNYSSLYSEGSRPMGNDPKPMKKHGKMQKRWCANRPHHNKNQTRRTTWRNTGSSR